MSRFFRFPVFYVGSRATEGPNGISVIRRTFLLGEPMTRTTELPERLVHVLAPAELCFQVVAAGGTVIEDLEDGRVIEFVTEAAGRTVTTRELVRADAGRRLSYEWLDGPLPLVEETVDFEPQDDGSTMLRYRGRFGLRPSLVAPIARRVVRRQLHRAVGAHLADAKRIAEARARKSKLFPRTGV